MNKFGFISFILTIFSLIFPFLPLGIYFGSETNPWLGIHSYVKIPTYILNFQGQELYPFGILTSSGLEFWFQINFLSFFFLFILLILAGIFSSVGFLMENRKGKRLIHFNFFALLFVMLFLLIGVSIYSEEIFGYQFMFFEIFQYTYFGFYILLGNLIIALIAYLKHPLS
jgi:hypothetical protein